MSKLRPFLASAVTLIAILVAPERVTAQGTPNVLLICVDDLGIDLLESYGVGADPLPAPRINALAQQGVRFENVWAAPVCTPSRAALLTGRYGRRTGVGHLFPADGLPQSEITIAEHLNAQLSGYATAAIGKWHVSKFLEGDLAPNDQGFDHFAGFVFGLSDYYAWFRTVDGVQTTCTNYATTQMVDDAISWIGTQNTAGNPWFCYFVPIAIHSPFQAPPAHLHTQDLTGLDASVDPRPFARAMSEALDNEIDRLLNSLGSELDNTVVIFTSDNGTERFLLDVNVNPAGGKGTSFETGLRVPMFVTGPLVAGPGRVIDEPVHLVDLFATVSELCGVTPPTTETDSVSLVPLLTDPSHALNRGEIYSESFSTDVTAVPCGFRAARDARYKLVRLLCANGLAIERFFDLQSDPLEYADLLATPGTLAPEQSLARARLSLVIDSLEDTGNGFTVFGSDQCVGSLGPLQLLAAGNPVRGRQFSLFVENGIPGTPVGISFGLPASGPELLMFPIDLTAFGSGPGCELLMPPIASAGLVFGFGSRVGIQVPIENIPALTGLQIELQAITYDIGLVGSVPLPLVASNGIRIRL